MIPAGTRRRKKLRRFSRNAGLCADSICDVSELLAHVASSSEAAYTINLRHSFEAPLRVDSGVLATPSQARARDLAPTLCRALMVQTASACRPYSPVYSSA